MNSIGTIGNLMVKIGADIGGLQRGLAVSGASISRFASGSARLAGVAAAGFTAGMAVIGAAAGAAAVGVYKLSNAASDLVESQNVVTATFKTTGNQVNKWAGTLATSAGIGVTSATKMVGTMGAMLKTMTGSEAGAEKMSKQIVQLSGDFASFYNLDAQTAFEKIRSGLAGETEPLKQLGYNMSVATLEAYALSTGMKTAYAKMSEGEKVQLRFNYLMNASKDAQGDFIRTSTGLANSQRIMKLNFENLTTTIGGLFMPEVTKAVQGASALLVDINKTLEDGFQESDIEVIGAKVSSGLAKGIEKFSTYVPAIVSILGKVVTSSIKVLVQQMPVLMPVVTKGLLDLFQGVFDEVGRNKQPIMDMTKKMVKQIADFVTDNAALIAVTGIEIILAIASGLIAAIPNLIKKIPEICAAVSKAFVEYDWKTIGADIMKAIDEGGKSVQIFTWLGAAIVASIALPALGSAIGSALIKAITPAILSATGAIVGGLTSGVIGLGATISGALSTAGGAIATAAGAVVSGVGLAVLGMLAIAVGSILEALYIAKSGVINVADIKSLPEDIKKMGKGKTVWERSPLGIVAGQQAEYNNKILNPPAPTPATPYLKQKPKFNEFNDMTSSVTKNIPSTMPKTTEDLSRLGIEIKKVADATDKANNSGNKTPPVASGAADAIDKLKASVKGLIDAMTTKTSSFANFVGMFDTFERTAMSGERVIKRLQNQVKAMREWKASLAILEKRGVSKEFVNELRNMGPGSVDYVNSVAKMSDKDLNYTASLVAEKYRIGGEQAAAATTYETKIQTNIEKQINLQVTGSKQDGKEIARLVMKELEIAGYRLK